jgi:hypothetical protein
MGNPETPIIEGEMMGGVPEGDHLLVREESPTWKTPVSRTYYCKVPRPFPQYQRHTLI